MLIDSCRLPRIVRFYLCILADDEDGVRASEGARAGAGVSSGGALAYPSGTKDEDGNTIDEDAPFVTMPRMKQGLRILRERRAAGIG